MITAKVLPDCTLGEAAEKAFRRDLSKHIGYTVVIHDIKRYRKPRSNQQCKTVMGVWMKVILSHSELGYSIHDKEPVYQGIKMQCWYEEKVNDKTGQVLRVPRETKNLTTEEYSEFMESFRRFVWDFFEINLPDPDAALAMI